MDEGPPSWEDERAQYQVRIRSLEHENQLLRSVVGGQASADSAGSLSEGRQGRTDGDTVVLQRSFLEEAERKYEAKKEELQQRSTELARAGEELTELRAAPAPCLAPDVSDEQVVALWNALRDSIQKLTATRFNEARPKRLLQPRDEVAFAALSAHWRTYLSHEGTHTCYLFQALLWRHLYHRLFVDGRQVLGPAASAAYSALTSLVKEAKGRLGDDDYCLWRAHTGRILHAAVGIDRAVLDDCSREIYEGVTRYAAAHVEAIRLREDINNIVRQGADLAAIFSRTTIGPLMSDHPGSNRTQGFAVNEKLMDVRAKCGKPGIVDMMITPILLKRDINNQQITVLAKADVFC